MDGNRHCLGVNSAIWNRSCSNATWGYREVLQNRHRLEGIL